MQTLELVRRVTQVPYTNERGAVGWLTLGIIIGVLLVVFGIIKFLIPGE